MKKVKYFYNTHTLRYEKLITPLRVKLLRVFGFIAATLVSAFIIVSLAQKYFPSAAERALRQENANLRYSYSILEKEIADLEQRMAALEKRDNQVYRSIFESDPIPDSARSKMIERLEDLKKIAGMTQEQLIVSAANSLNRLHNRLNFQAKSFDRVNELIEKKEDLLAAIPAIQPVSNKELERVASGFGYRIDPVYKIPKMHAGLDFTANTGTPIYATADGTVTESGYNTGGYGNHVVINHGFGYETLYAHMVRIKAKRGQKVKRGEVIGWVGNTGKSTGPHLHYEVHKNGTPVDPVYFFYNDLTPEQYDRLLKLAATRNQSFD
ncbi:MAG: peptidoglycan DD-metalloendopeptidase family protein [Chitinophagaceae bacterium]|nr:peptidoglycan DD-metalloendopeptidase family protein [Chitinophagaceae bacterium]